MRNAFGIFVLGLLAMSRAQAHGPQIQVTVTGGKIVTRQIILDGPYSNSLTPPKTVYVMPFLNNGGVTYSRPNNVDMVLPGVPEFFSGAGLAYGYGYNATTNPAPFVVGSTFSLAFTAGLKKWDGAGFTDPGVAQIQAFTGGLASITGSATTHDSSNASLQIPAAPGVVDFSTEFEDVHASARFRYFGDGVNPSVAPNGIYLLSFQLFNNASGQPSDPFYFVLNRHGTPAALSAAVASLGQNPSLVQVLVPEPMSAGLCWMGLFGAGAARRRWNRSRRS